MIRMVAVFAAMGMIGMSPVWGDEESSTSAPGLLWMGTDANATLWSRDVKSWDIRLMDAKKVSKTTMRKAFISKDVEKIAAALTNGLVVKTGALDTQGNWLYDGAMPTNYAVGASVKFYTLILSRAFDGKSLSYLLTDEKQGTVDPKSGCEMDFGSLMNAAWSSFVVEEPEKPVVTNILTFVWSGSEVPLGKADTADASKWEVELMDATKVPRGRIITALANQSYSDLSTAIQNGRIATTTGVVMNATTGYWTHQEVWTNSYDLANLSTSRYYTVIFDRTIAAAKSGYYMATGDIAPVITSSNSLNTLTLSNTVCTIDFGKLTSLGWTAYEKLDGTVTPVPEVNPIPEPDAGSVQLFWSGMNIPVDGSSTTSVTNWDVKLFDAAKVPREKMIEALTSTNYEEIAAAVSNGLVRSAKNVFLRPNSTQYAVWNYEGYLPKEYTASKYKDADSLSFYTVIFNQTFTNKSGKYIITEIRKTNIASALNECIIAFGAISNVTWKAYTIANGSSSGGDGGGDSGGDGGDGDGPVTGEVQLNWTGSKIQVSAGQTAPSEWKVILMDANEKSDNYVSQDELIEAFKNKSYSEVSELVSKGYIVSTSATTDSSANTNASTRSTASWNVTSLYLPEDRYSAGDYLTANSFKCYTLILNHSLADNQKGRYLISKVLKSRVTRKKVSGEEESYSCKLSFGSLYSQSWRQYEFENDGSTVDVEDEPFEVALTWSGTNVAESAGATAVGTWEFILMDAKKVSASRMRAAFSTARYGRIASLIAAGRIASETGAEAMDAGVVSASSGKVSWGISSELPDEYVSSANRAAKSFCFYTLILNHALEEGAEGRYFISTERYGNINATKEIAYDETEVSYSCVMEFGSQSTKSWRTYDELVYAEGEDASEDGWDEEAEEELNFDSAQVYNGYLMSGSEIAGSVQVKVSKQKKTKTKERDEDGEVTTTTKLTSAVTIALQPQGGKKVSLKGTLDLLGDGSLSVEAKDGRALDLTFTMSQVTGTFDEYDITATRDIFTSKDGADKLTANAATKLWKTPLAMAWENEDMSGYNNLSLAISSKGKVKITGTVEGQKVSTTAQLMVDGSGVTTLAVAYKKGKVDLAFTVTRAKGEDEETISVDGLSGATAGAAANLGEEGGTFSVGDVSSLLDDVYSELLPDGVAITLKGDKWVLPKAGKIKVDRDGMIDTEAAGDNPSGLKLTYKVANGTFTGSFKVYVEKNGKPKATSVSVSGVMIDGKGYGTATVGKVGTASVTIE